MTALVLLLLAQAAPAGRPPSAGELVKTLDATAGLKDKEKPFEIAVSLGRLYLSQGRAPEAVTFFGQAVAGAEPARRLYAAQLAALGKRPLPPAEPGCAPGGDAPLAALLERAKALAAKGPGAAAACLRAGLAPLMEAEVLLGHAQFLSKAPGAALATYSRSLELFPANVEARYARGALSLDTSGDDLAALARAKADLEQVLADAPASPRAASARRLLERATAALAAGGLSKLTVTPAQVAAARPAPPAPPQGVGGAVTPPVLTKEVMEAFQNAPRTAEMEDTFVKLIADAEEHLARGRFQDALTAYKGVMPYQPDNARVRAGLAWTMVRLNRQPMADNVWRVATSSPEAVIALGDVLRDKGAAEEARAVWQRLKDTVPGVGPQLGGRL